MTHRAAEFLLESALDEETRRKNVNTYVRIVPVGSRHACHADLWFFTWTPLLCVAHSAKIKAMCNAVPYDEFKQLVAGANLKPLDKTQSLMFVKPRGAAEAAGNVPFYSGDLPKAGKYVS